MYQNMYQADFATILVQKKQKSRPVNQSAKSEQTREKQRKNKEKRRSHDLRFLVWVTGLEPAASTTPTDMG